MVFNEYMHFLGASSCCVTYVSFDRTQRISKNRILSVEFTYEKIQDWCIAVPHVCYELGFKVRVWVG